MLKISKRISEISLPRGQVITAVLGILVSLWAIQAYVSIASGDLDLICDAGGIINCSKVIGSGYGKIFGIPLGFYGVSFWAIVLVLSVLPAFTMVSEKSIALWRLIVGSAGLIAAIALAIVALGIIKAVCSICETVQILCVIYFILTFLSYRKTRSSEQEMRSDTGGFVKIATAVIVAGVVPLLAGSMFMVFSGTEVKDAAVISLAEIMEKDAIYKETGNHSLGKKGAPVVITEFTDFECSWCRRFHKVVQGEIKKAGMDNVLLVFRNYPLKRHKHALNIAHAARCAGRQGYFWEFSDWAFAKAKSARKNLQEKELLFSRKGLIDKAVELGAHRDRFIQCLDSKKELAKIEQDKIEAKKLGLRGTPYILINGKPAKKWNKPGKLAKQIRIAAGLEEPDIDEEDAEESSSIFKSFFNLFRSDIKKSSLDIDKDGNPDHYSYTLREFGIMNMLLVDTDLDGEIDDLNWVKGNRKEPFKAMLLYSENIKKGSKSRIWYGPGNIKMIGQDDLDKDGVFETVVYYNRFAKPKVLQRIIARFETDADGNGRPDVWIYPERRVEIDSNGDGMPEIYSISKEEIMNNYRLLTKKMNKADMTGKPLSKSRSWALHPELIKEFRYQAIISQSLPNVQP